MIAEAFASFFSSFAATTIDGVHPSSPTVRSIWGGGGRTKAGVDVTEETALTLSAFWRGVNLLCNTMAKVSQHVLRDDGDGGWLRDREHFAYPLVRRKPNPEMTADVYRKTIQGHALTWGNGYSYIYRDEAARATEIYPLMPNCTRPGRIGDTLVYFTKIGGEPRTLLAENVLHIRGLTWNGICGYNLVEQARESIGASIGVRQFGSGFFGRGANAAGILQIPRGLGEDEEKRLRETFDEKHATLGNAHKAILLEDGAKFIPLTIPPEHAQFLQTKEFDLLEIANWLGVPQHKLGHSARTSYASLEQENQAYLDDSVEPWFITWESEMNDKLLTEEEKENDSHRIEFFRDALTRVDLKTTVDVLTTELNNGGISLNEYRKARNRPAYPAEIGDQIRRPANIVNEGEQVQVKAPPEQQHDGGDGDTGAESGQDPKPTGAQRLVARDGVERIVRRIGQQARKAAKDDATFCAWVDAFDVDNHKVCAEILLPTVACLAANADDLEPDALTRKTKNRAWLCLCRARAVFEGITATAESLKPTVEAAAEKLEGPDSINELLTAVLTFKENK